MAFSYFKTVHNARIKYLTEPTFNDEVLLIQLEKIVEFATINEVNNGEFVVKSTAVLPERFTKK